MESLATLFVSLVLVLNSLAPSAHIPQKLGVRISSSVLSENTETPEASPTLIKNVRLREAREENKRVLKEVRERREKAFGETKDKKEEFKQKVEELRDERKKEVVKRIDENLAKRNEKWVAHWNKVLSRLSEILAKIQSRTETAPSIAAAKIAIDAAQAAVTTQAGKTYVIEIGDEENLGENVSAVVRQFKQDIKAVHEKVKAARDAVRDAHKALKYIPSPSP